jgi:hypothetical protein
VRCGKTDTKCYLFVENVVSGDHHDFSLTRCRFRNGNLYPTGRAMRNDSALAERCASTELGLGRAFLRFVTAIHFAEPNGASSLGACGHAVSKTLVPADAMSLVARLGVSPPIGNVLEKTRQLLHSSEGWDVSPRRPSHVVA